MDVLSSGRPIPNISSEDDGNDHIPRYYSSCQGSIAKRHAGQMDLARTLVVVLCLTPVAPSAGRPINAAAQPRSSALLAMVWADARPKGLARCSRPA